MNFLQKTTLAALAFAGFYLPAENAVSNFTLVNPCTSFGTVTAIPGKENCFSFSVTNVHPGDQDSYYTWDFGNGHQAQGITVYQCFSTISSGMHPTVTLINNSPTCNTTPPFSTTFTVDLAAASGTNCNYQANVIQSALSVTVEPSQGPEIPETVYNFDYGDGTGTVSTVYHTYPHCGNYIITIRRWDWNSPPGNGCTIYAAVNMTCAASGTVTGINNSGSIKQVAVFPVPAGDVVTITSPAAPENIRVYDLTGKELQCYFQKSSGNTYQLNTEELTPGLYLLSLHFEDGSVKTARFIKN